MICDLVVHWLWFHHAAVSSQCDTWCRLHVLFCTRWTCTALRCRNDSRSVRLQPIRCWTSWNPSFGYPHSCQTAAFSTRAADDLSRNRLPSHSQTCIILGDPLGSASSLRVLACCARYKRCFAPDGLILRYSICLPAYESHTFISGQ